MVKIILIIVYTSLLITAEPSQILKNSCLNCHRQQQVPSELIYRRYLMKYSTDNNMKKKILEYLKNPKQSSSIMPKQFFLKFPMKKVLDINDTILEKGVDDYLRYFDIRKRLIII